MSWNVGLNLVLVIVKYFVNLIFLKIIIESLINFFVSLIFKN